MCKSTDTSGHTYVDTPEDGSQCSGEYTSGTGERRQWQHCTGCGNVRSRAGDSLYVIHYQTFITHTNEGGWQDTHTSPVPLSKVLEYLGTIEDDNGLALVQVVPHADDTPDDHPNETGWTGR